MATIIDGKKIAAEVRAELKEKIEKIVAETKRRPALAVILVGDDPASAVYVRNKKRAWSIRPSPLLLALSLIYLPTNNHPIPYSADPRDTCQR